MARNISYPLGILITIILGIFLYMNLCSDCFSREEVATPVAEPVAVAPKPTSYPFAVDTGLAGINVQDNYNFNLSSEEILMPLSDALQAGVIKLKRFLLDNPDKTINITGFYKSDETNNTAWPNLGMARANAIKNHMVSLGIPSSQTNLFGKLVDDMVPDGNTLYGPVSYEIADKPDDGDTSLKALYDRLKADPLVLYFDTGASRLSLTPEQRQKVADIANYLDKAPDGSCSVEGHTDNTGDQSLNYPLGQKRADFIKAYLIRNGIPDSKIEAKSFGQDRPIDTNATEEGRAKNRRTVVTLN